MLKQLVKAFRFSNNIKDKIKKEKMDRMRKESSYFPTLTTDQDDLIRNFGIIAHIDAGKTTTSERMLYYAGALPHPGEVHDGTTVMDYLPQERQRGITIRSAAISFNWNSHQYNLIDTPGHIDFTAEVECALRVLDGAIAIFDGVSGVETQSETVWFQANRFNIPRIAFINKMDRQGASLDYTLDSMRDRLNITPLMYYFKIPVGEADQFQSVIDLLDMTEIVWIDKLGTLVEIKPLSLDHPLYKQAIKYREQLLEGIANFDDDFANMYLDGAQIDKPTLIRSIRNVLNKNPLSTCPVYVGSALKNKGVQPLMDAVQWFLPAPSERPPVVDCINPDVKRKLNKEEKLCAYTYKVIHDHDLGSLAYTRIYSGILQSKQQYLNSSINKPERIQYIYRVRANKYVPIPEALAGDIVALAGAKSCVAGTTLISQTDPKFVLSKLEMPQCVFYACLEYESMKDKIKLDQALEILAQEDTSLNIQEDEGGQILIGGLGELHLEIVQQRLKEQWNLNTTLKKMQVEYKESIQDTISRSLTYKDISNNRPLYFNLKLKLEPLNLEGDDNNEVVIDFPRSNEFDSYYNEFKLRLEQKRDIQIKIEQPSDSGLSQIKFIRNPSPQIEVGDLIDDYGEEKLFSIQSIPFPLMYEIEQQLKASLTRGPLMSYRIVGVRASILGGQYTSRRTNELSIGRCIQQLIQDTLKDANPVLLEPVMNLEITTPNNVMQIIMNDLISIRRGHIELVQDDKNRFGKQSSDRSMIKGSIPLQETIGYSTYIRSISQGEASFNINYKQYDSVGGSKQRQILETIY